MPRLTLLTLCLLALAPACKKTAGPPAKVQVDVFGDFDGRRFNGVLTLKDATGRQVAADGTLTLTLVTQRDLCTASVTLRAADFRAQGGDPDSPIANYSASSDAPCERPSAQDTQPLNLRVRFAPVQGQPVEALQNALGASDWAERLKKAGDEAELLARVPAAQKRLSAILDAIAPPGAQPDEVACAEPLAGPVPRVLFDDLEVIAGRVKGDPNNHAWYYSLSDVQFQWLALWVIDPKPGAQRSVGEALTPSRYLEVVRVESAVGPVVGNSTSERRRDGIVYTIGFKPGSITAMLNLIDLDSGKLLCRGRVSATNLSEIAGGTSNADPLVTNLVSRFNDAAEALEQRLAKARLHPTEK